MNILKYNASELVTTKGNKIVHLLPVEKKVPDTNLNLVYVTFENDKGRWETVLVNTNGETVKNGQKEVIVTVPVE